MVDRDVSALAPALRQRSPGLITAEGCARTLPAPGGIAAPAACPLIPGGQSLWGSFFRGKRHVGRGMVAWPSLQHFFALCGWGEGGKRGGQGGRCRAAGSLKPLSPQTGLWRQFPRILASRLFSWLGE